MWQQQSGKTKNACESSVHVPQYQASHFGETKGQRRYIIEYFCLATVAHYNAIMGRVDRFDQRRERYAIGRRSLKWWHCLLYFLIDLAIVNSFIKRNCNNGGQSDQVFRLALVRQLTVGGQIKRGADQNFSQKTRRASAGYQKMCVYEKLGNICQLELQEGVAGNAAQGSTRPEQALCAATAR